MSKETNDFRQTARDALQNAPAVWTPQCPEPETLLDWVEQGEAHAQAAALLGHLLGCAHCRREHAALSEVRALSPSPIIAPKPTARTEQIGLWVGELIAAGFTSPVAMVRTVLEALDRRAAPPALAGTRGMVTPTDLRPTSTVVRTPQPTLRWSTAGTAQEFMVFVTRHTGRKTPHLVWEGSAGSEWQLTLPEQAGLQPGGIYLWQVTARTGQQEAVSAPAPLAVMSERSRRQVEALEGRTEEATLERISLYEAFGLYDEALRHTEMFAAAHEDNGIARRVRGKLQERMSL